MAIGAAEDSSEVQLMLNQGILEASNVPTECLAGHSPGVRTVAPAGNPEEGKPSRILQAQPGRQPLLPPGRESCYPTSPAILHLGRVLIFYLDEKCVVYTLSRNK